MKIIYINGFMGENLIKPQKLSQIFNEKIEYLKFTFNEGEINEQALDEYFEMEHSNTKYIIGASTGLYIARYYAHKYSLLLISLNLVVDIKKTFSLLNYELKLSDKFQASLTIYFWWLVFKLIITDIKKNSELTHHE